MIEPKRLAVEEALYEYLVLGFGTSCACIDRDLERLMVWKMGCKTGCKTRCIRIRGMTVTIKHLLY